MARIDVSQLIPAWLSQVLVASDATIPYMDPGLPIYGPQKVLITMVTLTELCGTDW